MSEKYTFMVIILVDGVWSSWSEWTTCNAQCGQGERNRVRRCSQPQNGGRFCEGHSKEVMECSAGTDCPGLINIWEAGKPVKFVMLGYVTLR